MNKNFREINDKLMYYNQVDALIQEILTQEEKLHVTRILILLGLYRVLDTDMLMAFYKIVYGKGLRLKYIKLAAKHNLIVEFKNEEKVFFYELKKAGTYALQQAGKDYFPMGYFWTNLQRNGIIEYNLELLKHRVNLVQRVEEITKRGIEEEIEAFKKEILDARYTKAQKDYFGYKTKSTTFDELEVQ